MSASYSAALVYGLPFKEAIRLEDELGLESVKEMIYNGELDVFPPYYDAPYEDSIVGIVVAQTSSYSFMLVDKEMFTEAEEDQLAREATFLEDLFGQSNLYNYLTTVGS